jgi:hypothetical protein
MGEDKKDRDNPHSALGSLRKPHKFIGTQMNPAVLFYSNPRWVARTFSASWAAITHWSKGNPQGNGTELLALPLPFEFFGPIDIGETELHMLV